MSITPLEVLSMGAAITVAIIMVGFGLACARVCWQAAKKPEPEPRTLLEQIGLTPPPEEKP